jgi:hypothetical protein
MNLMCWKLDQKYGERTRGGEEDEKLVLA